MSNQDTQTTVRYVAHLEAELRRLVDCPHQRMNMLERFMRPMLIEWLKTNDANGCYTDADLDDAGFVPATFEDLIRHIEEQLQ